LVAAIVAMASMARAQERAQPPASEPSAVGHATAQPGVLLLSIDDFTRPYVRLIFESFSQRVLAAPNAPAIYFESLDASRFSEPHYLEEVRAWLDRKYRDVRVDLVLPVGEEALAFLADRPGEPWPAARVLYLEVGHVTVDTRTALPQAGGIVLEDHFADALGVIRTILPETKQVALLSGASAVERGRYRFFADKVRAADLEPIVMAGVSTESVVEEVGRLPEGTVVLTLAPTVDTRGRAVGPSQFCELLAAADSKPVFTLAVHDLGCGSVGGLMRDWSTVGRLLGDAALERLERPSTEVVTIPVSQYTTLAFDDRELRRWHVPEARLPPGAAVRFREPNLWRDHRMLVLAVLGVALLQTLLIAGLVIEHRRRRRAEIESRRNLAAISHLDRRAAMGELATSLAHELAQPLNAILQNAGVAQMMLDADPGAVPHSLREMHEIIGDIRKDDVRASEVLRRMRGLLQKHELESRLVDLDEVVRDTVAIVLPDAKARQIQLEIDLAGGERPILGDRVHLQQVLLNLLMNAVDAVATMPADRRRVRVRTAHGDGEVRLAVEDAGTGIPADRIPRIFEPFYTTKSEGSGMGMGLAIARSIVEAHAGRMAAENNARGGATVWFSLPAPRPGSSG
jgi:signal transduction histidine kinase